MENKGSQYYFSLNRAICHFTNPKTREDNGYAILIQYPDKTVISFDLYNLPPGKHGFHIHEIGDMRKGCDSLGSHYNPYHGSHSGLNEEKSHLGDFGNIVVDGTGRCHSEIFVYGLLLSSQNNVIGRSMVIHEKVDDLGRGPNEESKKTGNSGARISCGIIGRL